MKLLKARVMNYKSIEDSGWVTINNVTCLVGKNESGKTAFLQALQKLSPIEGIICDFDTLEFPRKSYAKYRQIHDENPADVVCVEFELSEDEIAEIEASVVSTSKCRIIRCIDSIFVYIIGLTRH